MSPTLPDFLDTARRLNLLDASTLDELESEATRTNRPPAELAAANGLLTPVQLDIVETMRRPRDTVPGYEILEVAGQGGMGIVYRAKQLNLDRVVALKTLLVSQIQDASLVSRFEQEARTVASLRHPNIVAAFDFGRHQGRLFLVMEFIDGFDAAHFIHQQRMLAEATAWGLIRQTAAGLAHAAAQDVVHRDIKPANLLLLVPPEGSQLPAGLPMVKIADFGLAYLRSEVERGVSSGRLVGSPHYMAPEQLESRAVDGRADVYALGATAYHMLYGQPPFHGLTLPQIVASKVAGKFPEFASSLSAVSVDLMRELMAHDPADRPADYRSILERIDRMELPDTAATMPDLRSALKVADEKTEPLLTLAHRPSRRIPFRTLAAVILLGVLLGISLAGFWWWSTTPAVPGERTFVPSGVAAHLFDGDDLQPWLRGTTGNWTIAQNSEGANVLAGTDGVVRRQLLRSDDGAPIEFYALTVLVELHSAEWAEIRFGIQQAGSHHFLVRLTSNEVLIGEQQGTRLKVRKSQRSEGADEAHAVVIERQPDGWWVLFDGQLLGTVAPRSSSTLPEFQLAADAGPAWFSDIVVQALSAPKSDRSTDRIPGRKGAGSPPH